LGKLYPYFQLPEILFANTEMKNKKEGSKKTVLADWLWPF